mmetsp:Transcript_3594/g.5706  ORF Transcript_3594/g.5706 Transcript_3594/m.5706 type:complete len:246 (+) Transcript_3594:240-977(+)|eukprot:CAMPEP_0184318214 /NCGR_PEP_ID=MMETSP1049-20130417/101257_1 /TAXON_ID=77928 /ORGANISM="Proteomonas sulcata, Strain CCMP704" /LENGTH=245 /DNA_ID=CAMNT_0026637903 /DNA_START=679 /DNA_END=1416 /DNA_ORIENTATION=-
MPQGSNPLNCDVERNPMDLQDFDCRGISKGPPKTWTWSLDSGFEPDYDCFEGTHVCMAAILSNRKNQRIGCVRDNLIDKSKWEGIFEENLLRVSSLVAVRDFQYCTVSGCNSCGGPGGLVMGLIMGGCLLALFFCGSVVWSFNRNRLKREERERQNQERQQAADPEPELDIEEIEVAPPVTQTSSEETVPVVECPFCQLGFACSSTANFVRCPTCGNQVEPPWARGSPLPAIPGNQGVLVAELLD